MMSLLAAAVVTVLAYSIWRVRQPDVISESVVRGLTDVVLTYRCPRRHTFRLKGLVAPPPCPQCGQLSFVRTKYYCKIHGVVEANLRFAEDKDGIIKVSELGLPGKAWTPVAQGLRCPHCKRLMQRRPDDPLDAVRDRGGG